MTAEILCPTCRQRMQSSRQKILGVMRTVWFCEYCDRAPWVSIKIQEASENFDAGKETRPNIYDPDMGGTTDKLVSK